MNHTLTGTVNVLLSQYSEFSALDVDKITEIKHVHLASYEADGYAKVGTAQVTVTFFDRDTVVTEKISALRSELQTVRANAQLKAKEIEGEIQKLLAITNEVAA